MKKYRQQQSEKLKNIKE